MTDLERALQLRENYRQFSDNFHKEERKYFIEKYPENIPNFIKIVEI